MKWHTVGNSYNILIPYSRTIEMELEVDSDEKAEIAKIISSADSPVGIDAKKTHIIIIHKLLEIEKRLAKLEQK